jgi:AcrR family transcriptional regulator
MFRSVVEQAKRESILVAAAKAFARLGFKKASVEEIAKEAGVAKGTVYLAFDSKEDLFYQTVHREIRTCVAEVAKLIDPRVPADELLGKVSLQAALYLDGNALLRDLFLGVHDGIFPGWGDRFAELRALGTANAIEILRLGVRQGRFRADVDIEATARILQDLQLAGMMELARLTAPPPQRIELMHRRALAGLDLILNGLRPKGAAAS